MTNVKTWFGTVCVVLACLLSGCQRAESTATVAEQASSSDGHDHDGHDHGDHDGHDHEGHDHYDHDHDGHDHEGHGHSHSTGPKSFHAAVASLKEIQSQLDTAMHNENFEAAHGPLHDVGRLLNKLPELAADTDLAEADWEEVKAEAGRLFDAFGDVDSTFHKDGDKQAANEKKQAAYEKAKPKIDEGIAKLEAKLALAGDPPEGHDEHDHDDGDEGHDHDGHDHEGHDHGEDGHDHEGEQ